MEIKIPPLEKRKLEAILFDLDGTLVSSPLDFSAMRKGLEQILSCYGLDPLAFRSMDLLEAVEKAQLLLQLPLPSTSPNGGFRQEVEAFFRKIELGAAQCAVAVEGAKELLSALLQKGIRVAVVTRNCREAALTALYQSQILAGDLRHFVFGGELCLLSREDVPRPKPDPSHLRSALVQLYASGERSAVVGDHPMDIIPGRILGLRTIGILQEGKPERFQEHPPDLLLSSLKEVLPSLSERGWI